MIKRIRFIVEFKRDAVIQVFERGYMRSARWLNVWELAPSRFTRGRRNFRSHHNRDQRLWTRLRRSGG